MLKATANIIERDDSLYVEVTWTGVELDRPSTGGICVKKTDRKLAERLKRAIEAQVVHVNPKVVKDLFQQTYVQSDCRVMGRRLNADLRRLGY